MRKGGGAWGFVNYATGCLEGQGVQGPVGEGRFCGEIVQRLDGVGRREVRSLDRDQRKQVWKSVALNSPKAARKTLSQMPGLKWFST